MKEKPNFYAVIPATVRYDELLSSSQKLFYAEITAMSQKEGFCWASNSYFSNLYGVASSTVSSWVTGLKDNGHIIVEYEKTGKNIDKRLIYPIQKIEYPYSENQKGVVRKSEGGYSENTKENNTRVNNTSNNIKSEKIVDLISDIETISCKHTLLALHIWQDVDSLQPNNKTTQNAKVRTWVDPVRLMVEQDERTHQEIWKLWKKIHGDSFWSKNVLSTSKLRDKYDELSIKFQSNGVNHDQFINQLYT